MGEISWHGYSSIGLLIICIIFLLVWILKSSLDPRPYYLEYKLLNRINPHTLNNLPFSNWKFLKLRAAFLLSILFLIFPYIASSLGCYFAYLQWSQSYIYFLAYSLLYIISYSAILAYRAFINYNKEVSEFSLVMLTMSGLFLWVYLGYFVLGKNYSFEGFSAIILQFNFLSICKLVHYSKSESKVRIKDIHRVFEITARHFRGEGAIGEAESEGAPSLDEEGVNNINGALDEVYMEGLPLPPMHEPELLEEEKDDLHPLIPMDPNPIDPELLAKERIVTAKYEKERKELENMITDAMHYSKSKNHRGKQICRLSYVLSLVGYCVGHYYGIEEDYRYLGLYNALYIFIVDIIETSAACASILFLSMRVCLTFTHPYMLLAHCLSFLIFGIYLACTTFKNQTIHLNDPCRLNKRKNEKRERIAQSLEEINVVESPHDSKIFEWSTNKLSLFLSTFLCLSFALELFLYDSRILIIGHEDLVYFKWTPATQTLIGMILILLMVFLNIFLYYYHRLIARINSKIHFPEEEVEKDWQSPLILLSAWIICIIFCYIFSYGFTPPDSKIFTHYLVLFGLFLPPILYAGFYAALLSIYFGKWKVRGFWLFLSWTVFLLLCLGLSYLFWRGGDQPPWLSRTVAPWIIILHFTLCLSTSLYHNFYKLFKIGPLTFLGLGIVSGMIWFALMIKIHDSSNKRAHREWMYNCIVIEAFYIFIVCSILAFLSIRDYNQLQKGEIGEYWKFGTGPIKIWMTALLALFVATFFLAMSLTQSKPDPDIGKVAQYSYEFSVPFLVSLIIICQIYAYCKKSTWGKTLLSISLLTCLVIVILALFHLFIGKENKDNNFLTHSVGILIWLACGIPLMDYYLTEISNNKYNSIFYKWGILIYKMNKKKHRMELNFKEFRPLYLTIFIIEFGALCYAPFVETKNRYVVISVIAFVFAIILLHITHKKHFTREADYTEVLESFNSRHQIYNCYEESFLRTYDYDSHLLYKQQIEAKKTLQGKVATISQLKEKNYDSKILQALLEMEEDSLGFIYKAIPSFQRAKSVHYAHVLYGKLKPELTERKPLITSTDLLSADYIQQYPFNLQKLHLTLKDINFIRSKAKYDQTHFIYNFQNTLEGYKLFTCSGIANSFYEASEEALSEEYTESNSYIYNKDLDDFLGGGEEKNENIRKYHSEVNIFDREAEEYLKSIEYGGRLKYQNLKMKHITEIYENESIRIFPTENMKLIETSTQGMHENCFWHCAIMIIFHKSSKYISKLFAPSCLNASNQYRVVDDAKYKIFLADISLRPKLQMFIISDLIPCMEDSNNNLNPIGCSPLLYKDENGAIHKIIWPLLLEKAFACKHQYSHFEEVGAMGPILMEVFGGWAGCFSKDQAGFKNFLCHQNWNIKDYLLAFGSKNDTDYNITPAHFFQIKDIWNIENDILIKIKDHSRNPKEYNGPYCDNEHFDWNRRMVFFNMKYGEDPYKKVKEKGLFWTNYETFKSICNSVYLCRLPEGSEDWKAIHNDTLRVPLTTSQYMKRPKFCDEITQLPVLFLKIHSKIDFRLRMIVAKSCESLYEDDKKEKFVFFGMKLEDVRMLIERGDEKYESINFISDMSDSHMLVQEIYGQEMGTYLIFFGRTLEYSPTVTEEQIRNISKKVFVYSQFLYRGEPSDKEPCFLGMFSDLNTLYGATPELLNDPKYRWMIERRRAMNLI